MRYAIVVLAMLVAAAVACPAFAAGERVQKESKAQVEKQARDPSKSVETRINSGGERRSTFEVNKEKNPFYGERASQPSDHIFSDFRMRSPLEH